MKNFLLISLIVFGALLLLTGGYLYAQEPEDEPEYFGVGDCGDCHRTQARNNRASPHGLALQEAPDGIIAEFDSGEDVRTVQFPGESEPRAFTEEDIALVMGIGRYVQRYVYRTEDETYRVFPAEWNTVEGQWQPYTPAEDWLTDDAYDWGKSCAGCHTTGFDPETVEWVDDGVQCEACHGPGENHILLADELPRRPEVEEIDELRAQIVLSPDPQICGQCHSQGMTPDSAHPYPVSYYPGDDLLADDVFTLVGNDELDHWWASGHGKSNNMQFNEWLISAHSGSLETLRESDQIADACLSCHAGDYRSQEKWVAVYEEEELEGTPPEALTTETAQFGVSCVTCHDPHIANEDDEDNPQIDFFLISDTYALCTACHTATDATEGLHHPVQQMFEGQTVVQEVAGIPSGHFAADEGPDCMTCHMPRVPMDGVALASHTAQVIMPGAAADIEELDDTCSVCHGEQVNAAAMQTLIDDVQMVTETRLTAITEAMQGDEADWATQAVAFVAQDNSLGVHNPVYADALLAAVEEELGLVPDGDEEIATTVSQEAADTAFIEAETDVTETEDGIAPIAIAIMVGSVLLILIAGWIFVFKDTSS